MSKITRQKRTDNFTVVNNDVIQNKDLSWAAKGMLVYLLHLPDNWQINVADLSNRSKNGRDGTAGIIKELMNAGYISRVKIKNEKAQFKGYDYTVTDKPVNGKPVNGLSVDGSSVNGKAVTSKYYQEEELNEVNTNGVKNVETSSTVTLIDEVGETAVKVVEVIPSKAKKTKYIYPPTIEELVHPIYEKLLAKKRDHPNIVDCWNWANHQAEAFWLYQDKMGWKVEKLNSAIATWINKAIQYKTVIVPCPIQYKNNPANVPQPEQPKPVQTQITKQDLDARKAMFAAAKAELNQIGA
jgi:hypothetical protein